MRRRILIELSRPLQERPTGANRGHGPLLQGSTLPDGSRARTGRPPRSYEERLRDALALAFEDFQRNTRARRMPRSGDLVEAEFQGLSDMDVARAAMGQGWPFVGGRLVRAPETSLQRGYFSPQAKNRMSGARPLPSLGRLPKEVARGGETQIPRARQSGAEIPNPKQEHRGEAPLLQKPNHRSQPGKARRARDRGHGPLLQGNPLPSRLSWRCSPSPRP
jgi:hypothetical protein